MNAGEAIRSFRSEILEHNAYFPLDSDILFDLDQGYKEFVRLSGGVPDEIELDVDIDEPEIEIPSYVMRIREVRRGVDNQGVEVVNYTDVSAGKYSLDLSEKGEVRYLMIGGKDRVGRLIAIPVATDTLKVLINRLPMNSIASLTSKFTDIDDVHHMALVDWLKAKMYRRPNPALFNPNMGEFFENRFKRIAEEANRAQNLLKSKVRVVSYGGC